MKKNKMNLENSEDITPWQNLANGIVLTAVDDYRMILKLLQKNPTSKAYAYEKKRLETFFLSNWYTVLTEVDGKLLIHKIQKEFQEIEAGEDLPF